MKLRSAFELSLLWVPLALHLVLTDADYVGGHDDGLYVTGGLSLAHGMRLSRLHHGPVVPSMLSVCWRLQPEFPDNLFLMKAALAVVTCAGLLLTYRLLVLFEGFSPRMAAAAVSLGAAAPYVLQHTTITLSEGVYGAYAALALLGFWRMVERRDGLAGPALWLTAACWVRNPGLAVPVAAMLLFVLRKDLRPRCIRACLSIALALAPWITWTVLTGSAENASLYAGSGDHGWMKDSIIAEAATRIGHNLRDISQRAIPLIVAPALVGTGARQVSADLGVPWLPDVIGLSISSLVALGFVVSGRLLTPLKAYACVYLTAILLWPYAPDRYMVPFAPVLYAYLLAATGRLIGLHTSLASLSRPLQASIVCLLLGLSLWKDTRSAMDNLRHGNPLGSEAEAEYRALREAYAWIVANTAPGEPFACFYKWQAILFTRRPVVTAVLQDDLSRRGVHYTVLPIPPGFRGRRRLEHPGPWTRGRWSAGRCGGSVPAAPPDSRGTGRCVRDHPPRRPSSGTGHPARGDLRRGETMSSDAAGPPVCPICATSLEARAVKIKICPDCETPHHSDCWDYATGCSTFGCRLAPPGRMAGGKPSKLAGLAVPATADRPTPTLLSPRWLAAALLVVVLVVGLGVWLLMTRPVVEPIAKDSRSPSPDPTPGRLVLAPVSQRPLAPLRPLIEPHAPAKGLAP